MKIWLHINGVQEGPYDPDNLPLDRLTPDTPVWYDGLPGWLPASEAEVTARILAQREAPEQPTEAARVEAPAEPQYPTEARGYRQVAYVEGQHADERKDPPTYLMWSLLLTICCCNPVGIVPLILGAGVSAKLRDHDYDAAARRSDATEWWLAITIVTGLIMMPFTFMAFVF